MFIPCLFLLITPAQFIVHVCAPGVVAFQNVNQPSLYLCIKPEELTHGGGSYKSHLKVKDNGGLIVSLESRIPVFPSLAQNVYGHSGVGLYFMGEIQVWEDIG